MIWKLIRLTQQKESLQNFTEQYLKRTSTYTIANISIDTTSDSEGRIGKSNFLFTNNIM